MLEERGISNGAGEKRRAPVDGSVLSEGPEREAGAVEQEMPPFFSFHDPYLKERATSVLLCLLF